MAGITTEQLGNNVVTSEKLARSIDIPALTATTASITTLTLGGTAITATAAQLNGVCTLFDKTLTTSVINTNNSTTNIVVPAIAGKQFFPVFGAWVCAGTPSVSTVMQLVESTAAGVVISHVVADCATGVWAGPSGGTVVTTLLNTALTVSEGVKFTVTANGSLATTTAVRCIVAGYYI